MQRLCRRLKEHVMFFQKRRISTNSSDNNLAKLLRGREYSIIHITCDNILEKDPNHLDALLYKALAYQNQSLRTIPDAIDLYQRVIDLDPNHFQAKKNVVRLFIEAFGKKEQGLFHLDELLSITTNPTEKAELLQYRVRALWGLGKTTEAFKMIHYSLFYDPSSINGLQMLAKMYILSHDQQCLEITEQILQRMPNDSDLLLLLAISQQINGNYDESIATCDKGLSLYPHNVEFLFTKMFGSKLTMHEQFSQTLISLARIYASEPLLIPPFLRPFTRDVYHLLEYGFSITRFLSFWRNQARMLKCYFRNIVTV